MADKSGSRDATDLKEAAIAVRARAHAPYSGFHVGAAIRSEAGHIYAGCNVENASYPEGWCAETSAIAAMIAAGDRRITAVAVIGSGPQLCTPCGGCRQRLAEFAGPDAPVDVGNADGIWRRFALKDLLPESFRLNGDEP